MNDEFARIDLFSGSHALPAKGFCVQPDQEAMQEPRSRQHRTASVIVFAPTRHVRVPGDNHNRIGVTQEPASRLQSLRRQTAGQASHRRQAACHRLRLYPRLDGMVRASTPKWRQLRAAGPKNVFRESGEQN